MSGYNNEILYLLNRQLADNETYQRLENAAKQGIKLDWLDDVAKEQRSTLLLAILDGLRLAVDRLAKDMEMVQDRVRDLADRLDDQAT